LLLASGLGDEESMKNRSGAPKAVEMIPLDVQVEMYGDGKKRICIEDECTTKLSMYNEDKRCMMHHSQFLREEMDRRYFKPHPR